MKKIRSLMLQLKSFQIGAFVIILTHSLSLSGQSLIKEDVLYLKDLSLTSPFNRDLTPKDNPGLHGDAGFVDASVKDYVKLALETNKHAYISPSTVKTYQVILSITPVTYTGGVEVAGTAIPCTLAVKYDGLNAYFGDNDANKINDKHEYWFSGYYKFRARVSSVKLNGTEATPYTSLPFNLSLTAGIVIERYYDFDPDVTATSMTVEYEDDDAEEDYRYLKLKNFYLPGAIYYDVEWTYVNGYDDDLGDILPASQADFIFHNNSSRMQVTSDSPIHIPAVFDKGYVIFRVRGIGKDPTDVTKDVIGKWNVIDNYDDFTVPKKKVNTVSSSFYVTIGNAPTKPVHESNKNWMYQVSFAEEGKLGHSITYYDGTSRARQSIALNNAESEVMISEVFYDYQGRPAVQTLPAPFLSETGTRINEFKYYENFNKANTSASTGFDEPKFDRYYFDRDDPVLTCSPYIFDFDSLTSGVAKYYSGSNNQKNNYHGFIPSAEGYPYVLTQFTPDNTGRVKKQSGVGESHKIGSGHEVTYLYGKPNQIELDRLFGNNVGLAEHYQKNAVIDPNGQVSVAYLDMKGNVIATALAGKIPDNLKGLTLDGSETTMYDNYSQLITYDLLNVSELYPHGSANSYNAELSAYIVNEPILVVEESMFEFNYSMDTVKILSECLEEVCMDCVYDLKFSLIDDCGNELLGGGDGIIVQIGDMPNMDELTASLSCEAEPYETTFSVTLVTGNYTLTKSISLNQTALDIYADLYVEQLESLPIPTTDVNENSVLDIYEDLDEDGIYGEEFTCFQPIGVFESEAASHFNVDASCTFTCDDCNSIDNVEQYVIAFPELEALDETTVSELFSQFKEECTLMCTSVGNDYCAASYNMMLQDMSPNGQYAEYINPTNGELDPSYFPTSILNEDNLLQTRNFGGISYTSIWRNPVRLIDDTWTPGYWDDEGNRIKILVESAPIGGGYVPELIDGATVIEAFGLKYAYPEDLANVQDFIALFAADWAKSLIMYHPEYYSYEYCVLQYNCSALVGVAAPISMNTFEFDEYLLNSSYTELSGEGLLPSTIEEFLLLDPLFSSADIATGVSDCYPEFTGEMHSYYDVDIDDMITKLSNFLLCDIDGVTNYNIYDLVWLTNDLGVIFEPTECNLPPTGDIGIDAIDNDADWQTFVHFYIGAKQAYMLKNADYYSLAINEATGYNYYTGCIGVNSYDPSLLTDYDEVFEYEDMTADKCLCNFTRSALFSNKTRRFFNSNSAFGIDPTATLGQIATELLADADYAYYVSTGSGNMPLTGDIQLFLNGLIEHTDWATTTAEFEFEDISGTTVRFYEAVHNDLEAPNWSDIVLTGSNRILTWNNPSSDLIFKLEIEGTEYDWLTNGNEITQFIDVLNPTGASTFSIKALAKTLSDEDYTINILITTDELPINNSKFINESISCDLTSEMSSVANLFNYLIEIDEFNSTSYTLASETESLVPVLSAYIGEPVSNYIWKKLSDNEYQLYNGAEKYINFLFSSEVTAPNSIDLIKPYGTDDFTGIVNHFICLLNLVGGSTEASCIVTWFNPGLDAEGPFPVGDCAFPIPTPCSSPENYNAVELFNFIDGLLADDNLFETTTITSLPEWSVNLKNITGCGSETTDWVPTISEDGLTLTAIFDAGNEDPCQISLTLNDPTETHSIEEITSIDNLLADFSYTIDASSYYFTLDVTIGGETYKVNGQSTCIPLKNCLCDELPAITTDCPDYVLIHATFSGSPQVVYTGGYLDLSEYGIIVGDGTEPTHLVLHYCHEGLSDIINFVDGEAELGVYANLTDVVTGGVVTGIITDAYFEDVAPYYILHLYIGEVAPEPGDPIEPVGYPDPETVAAICDPVLQYFPSVEYINPCEENINAIISYNAQLAYEQYITTLKENFRATYAQKCLDRLEETFEYNSTSSEYQYTLYYYDQSNNLVMTVPPKGVEVLSIDHLDGVPDVYDVNIARATTSTADDIFPEHTMKTQYHYNSLNELTWQLTPDAGITQFWYDNLGRLVLSQNAKQNDIYYDDESIAFEKYSYTAFDNLSRIIEVGELWTTQNIEDQHESEDDPIDFDEEINKDNFPFAIAAYRNDVTLTVYDNAPDLDIDPPFGAAGQENLRTRVASVFYQSAYDQSLSTYDNATHFSYDIHGNVKTVIQDNFLLGDDFSTQQFKTTEYVYDLISGNVHEVKYQADNIDQFYHKYYYDANNRLAEVYTSRDNIIWEKESRYFYYRHGPLVRQEIGDLMVQGVDYAYTIQGWLKGVNASALNENKDMGRDGKYDAPLSAQNSYIAKDAYGFILDYFKGDYKRINSASAYQFIADEGGVAGYYDYYTETPDLFNGNIRGMSTALMNTSRARQAVLGKAYAYDQLDRISRSYSFEKSNMHTTGSNFTWVGIAKDADNRWGTSYTYDANGNILKMNRSGNTGVSGDLNGYDMDKMVYNYYSNSPTTFDGSNQLARVDDVLDEVTVGHTTAYSVDIDDQTSSTNYEYDEIGNLTSDEKEGITSIVWNVYGKIKSIDKSSGPDLEFGYDAFGNRIMKKEVPTSGPTIITYYTRDAQGNTLAVYTRKISGVTYDSLILTEQHIYGSARIGYVNTYKNVLSTYTATNLFKRILGEKRYELVNHLGNVLSVISDRRFATEDAGASGNVKFYEPDVVSAQDYDPFGMVMAGKNWSVGIAEGYRFGFNGYENTDEILGNSTAVDYGARVYDARIGKFFSIDPRYHEYAWQSPYAYYSNNPILTVDFQGKGDFYTKDGRNKGNDKLADDKAYLTTDEVIAKYTIEGKTDWNKVKDDPETELLKYKNSELTDFASSVADESSGDYLESYALANAVMNGSAAAGITPINFLANYTSGYKTKKAYASLAENYKYSMEAVLNAVTNGVDYSNGATRWDGRDLLVSGTAHYRYDKASFDQRQGIFIPSNMQEKVHDVINNVLYYYISENHVSESLFMKVYDNQVACVANQSGSLYTVTNGFGQTIFFIETDINVASRTTSYTPFIGNDLLIGWYNICVQKKYEQENEKKQKGK